MFQEIREQVIAYIVLLVLIATFVAAFVFVWPDRMLERIVILVFSVSYVVWGVSTHLKSKKITRFVVEEYLAVATLGGLILLLLTF